ncbi:contractile injection system protein, VgrG/Pvc8 family [Paenibacillus sp. 2KB_20]|uniref:contractile injection system protein, VgrG/Pvc8 family n=1 Tax=Paenibacillus sp. 2KB_20 TaxID=3232977 RepID=UPI003F99BC2A
MSSLIVAYDTLKIAPFEMKLHDVKLVKKINDHARLTFSGIIPEEMEEQYMRMANEHTPVELLYYDQKGAKKTLFHGMLLKLHIKVDREVYWLEAEAASHTYAMDIKLEYRAFQDKSQQIEQVMKHIAAPYSRAYIGNTFSEQRTLNGFTLQYQETDWQFLKRLASRYHAPLVPIASRDSICFYLGIPDHSDRGQIEATHYRVYKDLLAFKNTGDPKESGLSEQDFICYEIVLNQELELGDRVTFKNQQLHVFEVLTEMSRGVLTHTYTLCLPRAGYQRRVNNTKIIGASIQGKVAVVVRDEVKVKLEYDQDWNQQTAYLFPYSTMYASEDQTGWYVMPEKGDDVRIYFPSANEAEGIALSSVRKKLPQDSGTGGGGQQQSGSQNTGGSHTTTTVVKQEMLQPVIHYDADIKEDLMSNPDRKFFLTKTGQKIMFEEDKITIVGAQNGASITLTNEGTIILNSNSKIKLQTGKQIEMVSDSILLLGNQIDMSTKEGKAGITIDQGQVKLKGVEILMDE